MRKPLVGFLRLRRLLSSSPTPKWVSGCADNGRVGVPGSVTHLLSAESLPVGVGGELNFVSSF